MTEGPANPEEMLAHIGADDEPISCPRGRVVGKLRLLSLHDALHAPPRRYFLPGLLAPGEMSVWWGAPKCGKSFLLLRLAFGLALGRGMWGREPARPVRVLYCAAEGEGGLGARLLALHRKMGDPGDAFCLIAQRVQIGPPSEHLVDLIAAAKLHRAEVVIVDTLARTFGEGDENHPSQMGAFIAALDRLREEGSTPGQPALHEVVIHHGSKAEGQKTPRGSGALLGAADLVVKVKKGTPSVALVELAKDDAEGAELTFCLRPIELPPISGCEAQVTCVAEEAEPGESGNQFQKLRGQPAQALSILADLILREGNILPVSELFPSHPDLRGVPFEDWRAACAARTLSAGETKRAVNKAFRDASQILIARKYIATAMHLGVKIVWQAKVSGTSGT